MAKQTQYRNDDPALAANAITGRRIYSPDPKWTVGKARMARTYTVFAWAAVPVLIFALIATSFWTSWRSDQSTADAIAEATAYQTQFDDTEAGRIAGAVATDALQAWLDSEVSPLPGGRIVSSYVSFPMLPVAAESYTGSDGSQVITQLDNLRSTRFVVTTPDGTVWLAYVPVGVSETTGAQVLDSPSIVPTAPNAAGRWTGQQWPGAHDVGSSEAVAKAVTLWAQAYTSGNPATLLQVIGDPNGEHAYVPMSGTLVSANITGATVQSDLITDEGRTTEDPDTIVVRVSITLRWPGQETVEANKLLPFSLDLLVTNAQSASPKVVAWGAAGSAETLTPFMNAVIGRDIREADPQAAIDQDTQSDEPTQPDEVSDGADTAENENGDQQ